jgi:hypothetical protein
MMKMRADRRRINHSLNNGLLITQAQRHKSGVFLLYVSDLQCTERVVFDLDAGKVLGRYGNLVSDKDIGEVVRVVKKAFGF